MVYGHLQNMIYLYGHGFIECLDVDVWYAQSNKHQHLNFLK